MRASKAMAAIVAALIGLGAQGAAAGSVATPPFADTYEDRGQSSGPIGSFGIGTEASTQTDTSGAVSSSAQASSNRVFGLVNSGSAYASSYVAGEPIAVPDDAGAIVVTARIRVDQASVEKSSSFLQQVAGSGWLYVSVRAGLLFDDGFGPSFVMDSRQVLSGDEAPATVSDREMTVRAVFDPSWTEHAQQYPPRLIAGVFAEASTGRGMGSGSAAIDAHVEEIAISYV